MQSMQSMQSMPPGAGQAATPEQLALMQRQLRQLPSMPMSAPSASPTETLATLNEMAEIGLLPPSMHAELNDCIALQPQAAPAMGMAIGLLKQSLPMMREAREQMQALPPDEQDRMADSIADELKAQPSDAERRLFLETLDGGFFPRRVSDGVKARLGLR
jgi:hypothetical protein